MSPAAKRPSTRVAFVDWITRHPRTVLVIAGAATVCSLWGLRHVRFDYNLLHLQAHGTESVVWERLILDSAPRRSGFSALAGASSLDELRRKRDAFATLPSVSAVDSALLLIPEDQPQKLGIIRDFAELVEPIKLGEPAPVDVDRLTTELVSLKRRLTIAANEAPAGETKTTLGSTIDEVDHVIRKLRRMDFRASAPILDGLQREVYGDFQEKVRRLQANLAAAPVGLADVPPEIRRKFVSDRGHFLLQIRPAIDVWERAGASRFVDDLRRIDPEVTGTPIITYNIITLMERAYKQGTLYALALVTAVAALMLGRLRQTVLALLPLALGLVWTVGAMALLGLDFNMGNLFGLPLIIGVAVEYGVNIVIRSMEDGPHTAAALVARSTLMGVLIAGLCNIAGFGSLMLADHRGIFGLGLLITLGTASSLVAALVVLPVLLHLFPFRAAAHAEPPAVPAAPAGV
jgi:hypothetical protein